MKQHKTPTIGQEIGGSGLTHAGDDEMQLLRRLFMSVRRNALRIALFALVLSVLAVARTFTMPEQYRSTVQVMLDTRVIADPAYTPVVSGLPTTLTSLESELEVLRSTDLIERVVLQLGLHNDPVFLGTDDEDTGPGLVEQLRSALLPAPDPSDEMVPLDPEQAAIEAAVEIIADARTVDQVGATSAVYTLSVMLPDRRMAAQVANALAEEYLRTQTVEKIRSLERSQGWLTARTQQLQEALSTFSEQLESHQIEAPLSADEYETIKAQRIIAQRQLTALETQLAEMDAEVSGLADRIEENDFAEAGRLISQPNATLQNALMQADEGLTPELTSVIAEEVSNVLEALATRRASLQAERESIAARIEQLRARQSIQASHEAETRRIENEIVVTEAIYQDFVSQLSRRTEQDEYLDADGRIIEFARPASSPAEPRRASTGVMTFIVAGILGMLFVIFRELTHTRLRTLREIEETLELPVIGLVPAFRPKGRHAGALTAHILAGGRLSEPLRRYTKKLKASIDAELPLRDAHELRHGASRATVIAGTSALPGEGQSTALLLLAQACAAAGECVLILDCDFWNSPYRSLLPSEPPDPALFRERPSEIHEYIASTAIPGLDILTSFIDREALRAGDDLQSIHSAQDFKSIVHEVAQHYDRVFIDTPPLVPVMDTVFFLPPADKVIYFVRWNATPADAARSAVRTLHDVGRMPDFVVPTRLDLGRVAKYGDADLQYARKSLKVRY